MHVSTGEGVGAITTPNLFFAALPSKTRKLSYRKADRAMRPIYGCPEFFFGCP